MSLHPIPDRSRSRYAGQYAESVFPDRLFEIFADSERLAMTSKNPDTAGTRFDLAVEVYHQLMSLKLSAETCARIEYLLNVIDRFKIPVSKHKMEDVFAPVVNGPVKNLRDETARLSAVKDAPADVQKELAGKRALLLSLINFAGRMNFNTDALRV